MENGNLILGRIYKISSDQTDKVYYGSTTKTLNQRLSKHKKDYRQYLNGNYHFVTSFDIVKFDDCKIELKVKNFIKIKENYIVMKGLLSEVKQMLSINE